MTNSEHDSGHHGDAHAPIEDGEQGSREHEILERALRELLIERGVITAADVHRQIDDMDSRGTALGAKVVAKAWADADFRTWLLEDAKAAVASLGIDVSNQPELVAFENTPERHHVVVCTLCSCYPRMILGIPPAWYKSREYRARVVADPRGVLREFGTELPEEVDVRVVDSTADMRYLVVPMRPPGTEGWSEERLADLVSRDSMIGTAPARTPDHLSGPVTSA